MSGLPTITSHRLRSFESGDELRIDQVEGDDGGKELRTRTTNWFQRFVRLISIPFRIPDKKDEYGDAKLAILEALTREYGEEIGSRVFRANLGEVTDGRHLTSPYDPITGRQIRRMVEQGDREILEIYAKPENGGISYDTLWPQLTSQPLNTEASTTEWMLRKSIGMPSPSLDDVPSFTRFDRRDMDLRTVALDIPSEQEDETGLGHRLAGTILRDYEAQTENGVSMDGHPWTLDLKVGPEDEQTTYTIGVRIDPNTPDKVSVFDVNQCEVTVDREDLGRWLDAFLRKNYVVNSCELFRAKEKMTDPNYEREDGQWRTSFELDIDSEEFSDILMKNVGLIRKDLRKLDGVAVYHSFKQDVDRLTIEFDTPDRHYTVKSSNFRDAFSSLLGGDDDLRAILNLSALLNQNLENTPTERLALKMLERMSGDQYIPRPPTSRIVVSRTQDDMIRIDVDTVQRIKRINSPGGDFSGTHELDPRSVMRSSYSLQIPLDALREVGGLDKLQILKSPHAQVDFMPFLGQGSDDEPERLEIGLHVEGDHLVSGGLFRSTSSLSQRLSRCGDGKPTEVVEDMSLDREFVDCIRQSSLPLTIDWGMNLDPMPLDSYEMSMLGPFGLNSHGITNLSHLLSPSTVLGAQNAMMREMLQEDEYEPGDEMPKPHTHVTPVLLPNGKKVVDIEIRCVIPEGILENSKGTLLQFASPPQQPGRFETCVKLRIPVEHLNGEMPNRFDLIYPCRLEWRPQQ